MLSSQELQEFVNLFGVPPSQIKRDYLISHILKALSSFEESKGFVFFGGTSLCRTWTPDSRLSEDIDLLVDSCTEAIKNLPKLISRELRKDFSNSSWSETNIKHGVATTNFITNDASTVRLQFVEWREGWKKLPVSFEPVKLRYSAFGDDASLLVPTIESAVALKLMAWSDRNAPRDLFDLYELAKVGAVNSVSVGLAEEIIGMKLTMSMVGFKLNKRFEQYWNSELDHQTKSLPSAAECRQVLLDNLGTL